MSAAENVFRWATRQTDWNRDTNLLGVMFALFAGSIIIEMIGIELWLIRPIIVVPFLSFVPGYLVLRILQIEPRDTVTGLLYAIGLSLCFLMIYGLVLNTVLPRLGVGVVFNQIVLFITMLTGIGGLFIIYITQNDTQRINVTAFVDKVWHPWPLAVLCLPFLSVLGARTVTRFGDNTLILAVLTGLGFLTVAAYIGRLPKKYFPITIWAIAVSLLLHNSVLTHTLAWDVGKELRLATVVIENGVWDPTVGGRWMKNAMLRIVLLHPIYALLADIDLVWEFKTVSPILFSFAPVAFYKSYQTVIDRSDAFLAVMLPMSFYSFFTVLSVNSRTSGALLFLSLTALAVTDRTLTHRKGRVLMLVFLFGLIVSHYATAYLVLFAVGLVLLGNWVLFGATRTRKYVRTAPTVVILFGLLAFVWYVFIVYDGGAFNRLVVEFYNLSFDLWRDLVEGGSVVSAEDSTTAQYATTTYTSNTIRWLKSMNFALGILAAVSIAVLGLVHLWQRYQKGVLGDISSDASIARTEYFLYATAFLGVFGITFVGVDKLSTARTLMPALMFFAPFVILTPRRVLKLLGDHLNRSSLRTAGKALALTFVLTYFVLNVGLYGAVTEEYHPNILIDKERVVEDGSLAEKDYFWAMHYDTIYDIKGAAWLDSRKHGDGNDEAYYRYSSRKVISGLYNCTNLARQPIERQGSCDDEPVRSVDRMDKVYASAGSHVFYNGSR
ncbi:DUF2206 domain-containing protein [Halohasta salina]|uniref:DUF2206 domain-containing protein n=1 Tax=Halohasta salina TaxID=2961621 RepID=UPI0020A2D527|nr:DUF2206 domain-containing protein [Halohasta salina]